MMQLFSVTGMSAETQLECTCARHKQIEKALEIGTTLGDVVDVLGRRQVAHTIFSNEDQRISPPLIQERGYEAFQPVKIMSASESPDTSRFAVSRMVTELE